MHPCLRGSARATESLCLPAAATSAAPTGLGTAAASLASAASRPASASPAASRSAPAALTAPAARIGPTAGHGVVAWRGWSACKPWSTGKWLRTAIDHGWAGRMPARGAPGGLGPPSECAAGGHCPSPVCCAHYAGLASQVSWRAVHSALRKPCGDVSRHCHISARRGEHGWAAARPRTLPRACLTSAWHRYKLTHAGRTTAHQNRPR